MKLGELATLLKGTLVPPTGMSAGQAEATEIRAVEPIAQAKNGAITFVASEDYRKFVASTAAAAVIVKTAEPATQAVQLVHANPYWAFARTLQLFHPPKKERAGIDPRAFVAEDAVVDASATLYPFAYVGARARVGARAVLYPGAFVGDEAVIGADTVVRANAVVEAGVIVGARVLIHGGAVLGADGFGFAPGPGGLAKIPQIGRVVVEDDVEVGGSSTVDRGALEDTRIGAGSKLDSHVHVGHGTQVGKHCLLCGLSGIAGSAKLGDGVVLAGHSGVDNRVEIAAGSIVGAMSGVTKDLSEKGTYMGFPAQPAGDWRRMIVRFRQLGDMDARLKALEAKLSALAASPKG